ncbi:MAG TPA: HlyD family efflux transporter periplasmic adaptor subunit [Casimicrobiaceae bacterium]|nr:HlyD family efflux transporter periplasmic adaptor subunit [Casimicrobiaceae bacterium]
MGKVWVRRGLWALAAVLAAAALAWVLYPKPLRVDVAAVTRGTFVKTVDEDGKTRVRERYLVSAPLAGRLLRIELDPGDAVEPGSLLATLVPGHPTLLDARTEGELAARIGAADARRLASASAVARASVALQLAQSDLGRARDLGSQGFVSRQAVERAEREVELRTNDLAVARFDGQAAEHELALARAALMRAREAGTAEDRQRWEIRSPVAGRVLRVIQQSEAIVPVGAPLVEIGDPRGLEAVVDVLTTDAESIGAGTPVTFDPGPAGEALAGLVRVVEPSAFTKVSALGIEEQRVNVVIDLTATPQALQRLGDGYRVDAHILVARRESVLQVPVAALFRHGEAWAVFVITDGRARRTDVRIGPQNGMQAVVEAGLDERARVIIYPADAVRDGVRVTTR